MTQSGAKIHRFVSCCSERTCVSWRRWAQSWRSKGLCDPCKPQRRMNIVLEVALVRIEVFLGWAMLAPYSQYRKAIVTEATWSELERLLQEPGWPRQGLGRHVGRLYGKLVGAVAAPSQRPAGAAVPGACPAKRRISTARAIAARARRACDGLVGTNRCASTLGGLARCLPHAGL